MSLPFDLKLNGMKTDPRDNGKDPNYDQVTFIIQEFGEIANTHTHEEKFFPTFNFVLLILESFADVAEQKHTFFFANFSSILKNTTSCMLFEFCFSSYSMFAYCPLLLFYCDFEMSQ